MAIPLLSVREATVLRDGKAILDRLSFDLWEGEHVAILGPNGAGKSTLLRLIDMEDRALAHDPPAVRVLGQDRWDVSELRRVIGIVAPAHLRRYEEYGVLAENCVLASFFSALDIYPSMRVEPDMRERALQAMELAECGHLAHRNMATLSTGEARRVLIARALALNPRALLLDEPTAGLDIVASGHFLATVRKIAQAGTTVILVTHHVEEVVPEITRVLLLRSGSVAFDGPTADALRSDRLSEIYQASIRVDERDGRFSARLAEDG